MSLHSRMVHLCAKVSDECLAVDDGKAEEFIRLVLGAKRIFIAGAGRSGLVASAFGMRLMHLGFSTFIVGETITPPIGKGGLLVLVSGSGRTPSMITIAKTSKKRCAKVAAITSFPNSAIGRQADCMVQIRGRRAGDPERDYMDRQLAGDLYPMHPLGTLFELSTAVFLDSVVEELMARCKKSEKEMRERHTNLE